VTVHSSATDTNHCHTVLLPALQPPSNTDITVGTATDAFPQPILGDPIKLSHTVLSVTIPAALLQAGITGGIITDGMVIPAVTDYVITATGSTEGSHTYHFSTSVTIDAAGGVAQPLHTSINSPEPTWHPINAPTNVFFTEKSLGFVATLDLTGTIGEFLTATFTCLPSRAPAFANLGATGAPPAVTTTTSPPTTTIPVATTAPPTGVVGPAAGTGGLPRTGSSSGVLFVVAAGCLSMGLFALKAASSRRRVRNARG